MNDPNANDGANAPAPASPREILEHLGAAIGGISSPETPLEHRSLLERVQQLPVTTRSELALRDAVVELATAVTGICTVLVRASAAVDGE